MLICTHTHIHSSFFFFSCLRLFFLISLVYLLTSADVTGISFQTNDFLDKKKRSMYVHYILHIDHCLEGKDTTTTEKKPKRDEREREREQLKIKQTDRYMGNTININVMIKYRLNDNFSLFIENFIKYSR